MIAKHDAMLTAQLRDWIVGFDPTSDDDLTVDKIDVCTQKSSMRPSENSTSD